ncbi:MAG: secretin N-terminal domain-containing protein [Caulobacteraceae bacterium]|nr:secretin N-terminal domain-containing protein [Caulobacteraceae bacterium]
MLLVAILFVSPPGEVRAQGQVQSEFARLITVTAAETGPGQSTILLTFAPSVPQFMATQAASAQPTLTFNRSTRGSGAVFQPTASGLLRSITFEQQGPNLMLKFAASRSVTITTTPTSDQTLSVTFRTGAGASASPGPSVGAPTVGALPRHPVRGAGEDGVELVMLKYADVSEVVGLLAEGLSVKVNDVFTPQTPSFGASGLMGGGGGGGAQLAPPPQPDGSQPPEPYGQAVDDAISVDRRLNAIILRGSPGLITRLKAMIAMIDVPVGSVLLETQFIELDDTASKSIGLDFNNVDSQIGVITFNSGAFNTTDSSSGKSLTSAALRAAIYAQVKSGHGRIVSKPRIAAQSGTTAMIITGDALPILTSIALSGVNAVSQQVQYVNVGVTLQIAPRVTSDGYVTSHVFAVASSVTGSSQGYPTISQREAVTSATVRDGEAFVIGGLTEESDTSSSLKVPGLSSVPLIGQAFKWRSNYKFRGELYIIITPHIIRHGHDAGLASTPTETPPPLPSPPDRNITRF